MTNELKSFSIRNDAYKHRRIVCFCRQIDQETVNQAIKGGASTFDAVRIQTGAGLECGSCQVYINEMLGHQLWFPVSLVSIHRYSENYCAFQFSRCDGQPWSKENPGAYFIFQVFIDGNWLGRPYAITDDGSGSGLREIIVKRKLDGRFTNWLFDHLAELTNLPLRVSSCMGGSVFNYNLGNTIICLIGGVGITPVIALTRALAKSSYRAAIFIDYSATDEEDFFCRKEFEMLAQYCGLHVNFRSTSTQGRICQSDIDKLVQRYPQESFYICGPEPFKNSVIELLRKCSVTSSQIIDLEGSQTRRKIQESPQNKMATWGYRAVGLLLLLLYLLQEFLGLKLDRLQQLQAQLDYKILSGLLLMIFILSQWRLPLTRWLNKPADTVAAKKLSHKYFGAIAPLVFYLHASSVGSAYLLALSSIYLANSLIGYASGEFVANRCKKAYLFIWTILHVGLSTCLLFLSAYHNYIALAYK